MLRTRLVLGLLPLVLLIVATGGYAIYVCRDLAGALSRDLVSNYRSVVSAQQMRTAATMMNAAVAPVLLTDTERRLFEEHKSAFMRELMAQAALSAGTPRSGVIAALDEEFRHFRDRGEALVRVGGAASLREAIDNSGSVVAVYAALDRLAAYDVDFAQRTAAKVDRLAEATQRVMLITIAGGVALFLFLAWRVAASILAPIRMLTASAVALGDGDLDREVPELSGDELGQLAQAFNTMAGKLRSYRNATVARVLRAQRTMEATLTSAPDPLFVVGADGTVEVKNPAAEQLAALPEFAQGFPPELAEALLRVLASGDHDVPTDYSRAITLRVGREDRFYMPRILAIGDKLTEFSGAAIILQDVTKFRLMDDAKSNLVGTVSHELKTPLTSLRMALYLLLEQELAGLTTQQRELLEDARLDADRLLRILDTLLDLSRLEGGATTLERTDVGVRTLVQRIAAEAQSFIGGARQRLTVALAPELADVTLNVDEDRIRHVFMNLLTNASKYSSEGSEILLAAAPGEPGFVRFSVRDHGPGIPEASVGRIFDRFYRAPNQERRTGAGLGLAIAREIVVAHGGSIACTSEEGKGSEFYFILPLSA